MGIPNMLGRADLAGLCKRRKRRDGKAGFREEESRRCSTGGPAIG